MADISIFSANEQRTLEAVVRLLGALSTSEVVELSHRENAWLNNYPNMGIIPFTEAYKISL